MTRSIDTRIDFLSPLSALAGLGDKRVAAFNEADARTVGDLLYRFPLRYIDRSVVTPIADCAKHVGATVNVIAAITASRVERGRKTRFRIQLTDDSGSMEALWFAGIPFLRKSLATGQRVLCTGVVSQHVGLQMIHPAVERIGENLKAAEIPFLPVYSVTLAMKEAGIQQKLIRKVVLWALDNIRHFPKILPTAIETKHSFPSLEICIRQMHIPSNPNQLEGFKRRLIYEELYRLAITLRWSKRKFSLPGRSLSPGDLHRKALKALPFSLTPDQESAVAVLHADAIAPTRMHRLLQGDVGSGKTAVAFLACLPALAQGMQVAWLAPTEILARQAIRTLSVWLRALDIVPELLVGQSTPEHKRNTFAGLANGNLRFVVGTHSLLSPQVKFCKLGMIVIDEQHKFGAQQRLALAEKDPCADLLVMSATPIPQTLAQTLYSDLEIVSIRSTIADRKPVSTHLVPESKRGDMERFILKEIVENGGQAFFVAPRIETNDVSDDGPDQRDVYSVLDSLKAGPLSSVEMGLVHGALDPSKREQTMQKFSTGKIKVLVSTTIVEVGIDVPAATVLVVENAERFGLSQLHQLRGRVGRSEKKSFCFLLANTVEGSTAFTRLSYFCSHHDGFEIAEQDLLLRGPGEVAGFRQSGWEDLILADMLRDAGLFREINKELDVLFAGSIHRDAG
jgi:ATP-dependent DNA helicase RecG